LSLHISEGSRPKSYIVVGKTTRKAFLLALYLS
jgi:hypothetical protein